jgi:hypothetical protein
MGEVLSPVRAAVRQVTASQLLKQASKAYGTSRAALMPISRRTTARSAASSPTPIILARTLCTMPRLS